MAKEFEIVDVWVGRFQSPEAADAYFDETYDEDDDRPISEFARDMGESFYDHDFMERQFLDPPTDDLRAGLAKHSFSSSYLTPVVEAFRAAVEPFNLILLVWNCEIENPVTIQREQLKLGYLGRFACDPRKS